MRQNTNIGVCRGVCWTSSPKARKAGNGFIDWDKVIVLDASTSQSVHAKAICEPACLYSLRPTPDGIYFIDHHYLTTASPHTIFISLEHPLNELASAGVKTSLLFGPCSHKLPVAHYWGGRRHLELVNISTLR